MVPFDENTLAPGSSVNVQLARGDFSFDAAGTVTYRDGDRIYAFSDDQVPLLWAVVIEFVVSGVSSYFLLNRQREAFARRVDQRARRVSTRFEEMKAKEDVD